MRTGLSLLAPCLVLTGCAGFKTPDRTVEAPAVPATYAEKAQAWAADTVKQQREAEREKFEKDLNKSIDGGPAR